MFKTIIKWLRITNISKQKIFLFLGISLIETICYLFIPLSYANIASSATSLNIKTAQLWALINFLTQILNYISTNSKSTLLKNLASDLKNEQKFNSSTINTFCNFWHSLNNAVLLSLKLISILILASIYSLQLFIYLLISICACVLISLFFQFLKLKKSNEESKTLLQSSNHNKIIIDCIWAISTLVIIIITIHLFSVQKLTLTIFLLISSFINNHLIKPNFTSNFILKLKELKVETDKFL